MNGWKSLRTWGLYLMVPALVVGLIAVGWNVSGKAKKTKGEHVDRAQEASATQAAAGPKEPLLRRAASETEGVSAPPAQAVEEVHEELRQIIERTNHLQRQVEDNRLEIHRVLERAKIHERILRTMSVPEAIRSHTQVNVDRILQQEKVRLIAEQTRQTQDQLRALEQARTLQTIRTTPSKTKAS